MEQMTLDEFLNDKYKIKSNIKCIEFFAGYGSTTLAWKYLLEYYNSVNENKVTYKHHKICEWATPSIIAYASLHRNELENYGKDYCGVLTKEQIAEKLFELGVSINYNEPAPLKQLKRISVERLKLIYNSIKWSNNLVDISRTKGEDLEIVNDDKTTYILSYSFPCQDISNAGLSKGFSKSNDGDEFSSETRSGLLWQVERILKELYDKGKQEGDSTKYLPELLFCENVPLIESAGENLNNLIMWKNILESLGYNNYSNKLQATDYGIPQTRNRFYMFSILKKNGNSYFYKFPKKIPLELKLKDMLEDEGTVDEKYYLSEKLIQCFMAEGTGKYPRRERFLQNINRPNQDIANSITTLAGNRATDNFIINKKNKVIEETLKKNDINEIEDVAFIDGYNRNIRTDGNSCTITTRVDASNNNYIAIKNKTKKGYLEATEGDGIDISSRMEHHRGTVQKDKAQTITTMGGENVGVVVKKIIPNGEYVGTYDYAQSDKFRENEEQRLHLDKEVSGALLSSGNHNGIVVAKDKKYSDYSIEKIKKNIVDVEGNSGALTATGMQSINHDGCQLISLKRGYDVKVKPEQENPSGIDVIGNYSKSNYNQTSIVGKNGVSPTVTENHGQVAAVVVGGIGEKKSNSGTQWYQQDRVYDGEKVAIAVTTSFNPYYDVELRIRKLTPCECFRLQGVKDQDYNLIKVGQTDSKLYHLAGDSICCYGPLLAMYCQLLDVDFSKFFEKKEWWK